MNLIKQDSLADTLDGINAALFAGVAIPQARQRAAAEWIAARQGLPGAYAGMFAPTEEDFRKGIRLFTGERFTTRAGSSHVLGEEACRVLLKLAMPLDSVREALRRATEGMTQRLVQTAKRERNAGRPWPGAYCCARCTCAVWRHIGAGGLQDASPERWLTEGMKLLRSRRDDSGRWQGFPFYYTLLALAGLDTRAASAELTYAAPACERLLRRAPRPGKFDERRRLLAERVLGLF